MVQIHPWAIFLIRNIYVYFLHSSNYYVKVSLIYLYVTYLTCDKEQSWQSVGLVYVSLCMEVQVLAWIVGGLRDDGRKVIV